MLEQHGVKARYIGGSDDFPVGRLREVRAFGQFVRERHPGIGVIPKEVWDNAVKEYIEGLKGNPLRADMKDLLALFKKGNQGRHDLSEWDAFVREIRISDAVKPQKGVVHVSTMHKSKGKEFNNVFVYQKNYPMEEDKDLRLLYVCLLYTSDAADERSSVDLGGRRIIKKKNNVRLRLGTLLYDHR